jgi:endonuclease/exonuclease/phosphatase family metal-dependent hydrolase
MTVKLATYNVENFFARAKALDSATWAEGQPALAAFETFNKTAAEKTYTETDKATMLDSLETLKYLVRNKQGDLRPNRNAFDDAWAVLRENKGDFLVAPANKDPRIVATGRSSWQGWVELTVEPVDETATQMTAKVIQDVNADILCVSEADNRPNLNRFNLQNLDKLYAHAMLVDGNDPRGIDVGLLCKKNIDVDWVSSHVDDPDPDNADRALFSRDCPVYHLRLPSGDDLYLLLNHLKSQSWTSGDPDPLRRRQAQRVLKIYNELRAGGAKYLAVLGDLNKGPDSEHPTQPPPTLEPLLGKNSPLVDAYTLEKFTGIYDAKDIHQERPGSFESCTLPHRFDYILLSPELAKKVTDGGIFRKGLWGDPSNLHKSKHWEIYDDIQAAENGASDHAAVWIDLNL